MLFDALEQWSARYSPPLPPHPPFRVFREFRHTTPSWVLKSSSYCCFTSAWTVETRSCASRPQNNWLQRVSERGMSVCVYKAMPMKCADVPVPLQPHSSFECRTISVADTQYIIHTWVFTLNSERSALITRILCAFIPTRYHSVASVHERITALIYSTYNVKATPVDFRCIRRVYATADGDEMATTRALSRALLKDIPLGTRSKLIVNYTYLLISVQPSPVIKPFGLILSSIV